MPQLTDYLKALDAKNEQRIDSIRASINSVAQSQSQQSLQLQQLTSGNLTFRLEAPQRLQLLPPPPLPLLPLPLLPLPTTASSSTYTSAPASLLARSPSPPPPHQGPSWLALQLLQQQEQEQQQEQPPKHQMCRTVKTVEALWREWTVGLQGNPSIEVLDRKWGNHWRAGRQSELQWYSLRLEVIREIKRVAQA